MGGFLSRPSLGGWLTIAYGALMLAFALLDQTLVEVGVNERVLVISYLGLQLPLGVFALPGLHGYQTRSEVVIHCVAIGMNSFIWGYGLAWFVRSFGRKSPTRSKWVRHQM